jgi:hypothetical protein
LCSELDDPEIIGEDSTRKTVRGTAQVEQRIEEPGRTSG